MKSTEAIKPIPFTKMMAVLVGFPGIATLLSLLLLNRSLLTDLGLDFFNTFWTIITCWYFVQIYLISKILFSSGWKWEDIGISFKYKRTLILAGGYWAVAIGLLIFIEIALANSTINTEKMNTLSSLTPKTTLARIIFILMGFAAGLAEEIVYRGFAISALKSHRIHSWLAVIIASIPFVFQHGLKSIDQFWWFLFWGFSFGLLYLVLKKLYVPIVIHWLVILSALVAVLQVIE
ncbi:MAG: CPBP family intramembrane glutamic endopeptidase [Bacteroidota bacterium]